MKITELYTGEDNKSHFRDVESKPGREEKLGYYSAPYSVKHMMFRKFTKGAVFDWHTAPQPQYIIYLEGEVEVEIGSGEKRIFKPGDILFATDIQGEGHVTTTLTDGRSVIIAAEQFDKIKEASQKNDIVPTPRL